MVAPSLRPTTAALVLVSLLLAGCADDGRPPTPAPTVAPPFSIPEPDLGPLPGVSLRPQIQGAQVRLTIHLDGDATPIAGWRLDHGDGEAREQGGIPPPNITHVYPQPADKRAPANRFTARLTLFSAAGQSATAEATIRIDPPPNRIPNGALLPDTAHGPTPLLVRFTLAATDPDGRVVSWRLDPGDGNAPINGDSVPAHGIRHEYRRLGTHNATLTLHDEDGANRTIRTQIHVTPPQRTHIWTWNATHGQVTLHAHDATPITRINITRDGCPDRCPQIITLHTTTRGAFLLIDRPGQLGLLTGLEPEKGRPIGNTTLYAAPRAMSSTPDGTLWVVHDNGTLVSVDHATEPRVVHLDLPPGPKTLHTASDGRFVIVTAPGPTGRVIRIDTTTLRPDTAPLMTPRLHASAYDERWRTLVAADTDGRALLATTTAYGPVPMALLPLGNGAPITITCRSGADACAALYDDAHGPARLVRFQARPDPLAALIAPPESIQLPPELAPSSLLDHPHASVVAFGGERSGFVILGPDGQHVVDGAAGAAPHALTAHAQHPRFIYHLDARGAPAILDLEERTIAHRGPTTGGADGLALSYLKRTLA